MVEGIIAAIVGIIAGVGGKVVYDRQQETKSKNTAEQVIAQAERKASDIVLKAKDEALRIEKERRKELQKPRIVWRTARSRLTRNLTSLINAVKNYASKKTKLKS